MRGHNSVSRRHSPVFCLSGAVGMARKPPRKVHIDMVLCKKPSRSPNPFLARALKRCHRRFKDGDNTALLDALDYSVRSGSSLPLWAATVVAERLELFLPFR